MAQLHRQSSPSPLANEDELQSLVEPSQQSQELMSETYLVGFIIANIVGLQYHRGRINGREMVGLIREPLNQYDENAIKVFNIRSTQVGHIERSVAAVLSPLIDSHMIVIEGIVPNTRSNSNAYKILCQIHIFAKLEDSETVKSTISSAGLLLISESNTSFGLSDAVVVKEQMGNEGMKSVDKIFKLVGKNVTLKGNLVAAEPPREVIKSELLTHQKEGLGWLLQREKSEDLPPFWEEKDGEFLNVLTNYRTDKRPEPLRGGVFADDMGLGKSLTLLSLIAFDRYGNASTSTPTEKPVDAEEDKSEKKGKKRGRGNTSESRTRNKLKPVGVVDLNVSKATLIVCPPSVLSVWITQLEEHTVRGSLKVYIYHGYERTNDVNELMKYDIVLTTYGILSVEKSMFSSPVKEMDWRRIILDEAHTIKNAKANQSEAVCNLKASHRWAVTGTPIQNGSVDLYSLMAFLRFEPFSVKSYWESLIQRPLGQGNKTGLSRLQVLMASISLRRTKENSLIGLPPKTVETCYVELSPEERQLYDQMEGEAKGVVRNLINSGSLMRSYSTILSMILRLRQLCDDISLCPPELRSFITSTSLEDVTDKPDLLQKLVAALQDGEDFDCPICISPPKDIIITRCAHIFCRACILQSLQRNKPLCPLCRGSLTQSDLYNAPPPDTSNTDKADIKSSTKSSKVSALLSLLMASREENPNTKSVVFSQFKKMLLLLETPLKAAGFTVLRLDGTMTLRKRTKVIKEFGNPDITGSVVLLASLKASSTGINLTAASRVYLFEPWWNPAVEEQAMDRIHRIGQRQEVRMIRMIARNSIEERVLKLQQRKKNLANEAFKNRNRKDQREVKFEDVLALMSLQSF